MYYISYDNDKSTKYNCNNYKIQGLIMESCNKYTFYKTIKSLKNCYLLQIPSLSTYISF